MNTFFFLIEPAIVVIIAVTEDTREKKKINYKIEKGVTKKTDKNKYIRENSKE